MPDIHVMTSDSPIIWGNIDLETVRGRVFRWTLENLDFDWLIMLSERDYPIAPCGTWKIDVRHPTPTP